MFVHPKTGVYGAPNITNQSKASLYKDVLESIKSDKLYRLIVERKQLIFIEN